MSEIKCPHCGADEDYAIEEFPLSPPYCDPNRHFTCNRCGHCWVKNKALASKEGEGDE